MSDTQPTSLDSLTIAQAREAVQRGKEIEKFLSGPASTACDTAKPSISTMIGKYVIVRCRDAGVHAGILESTNGRECVLNESRRLWYWKPANGQAFLSGVAAVGLDTSSKIGAAVRVHLTENCEIIECSDVAKASISGAKNYEPK